MVCWFGVQLVMSYRSVQPSWFVCLLFVCLFYLHYFLLRPICNGWRVALKRSLNKQTEKQEGEEGEDGSLGADKSWAVSKEAFIWGLFYRHTQQVCGVMIVMHYLVEAVNGRISGGRLCAIITAGPEEHMRVKLAQRHSQNIQYTASIFSLHE